MDEIDDSYLALLFEDHVYIETPKKTLEAIKHEIILYVTHTTSSVYEDNLIKCFQRLGIEYHRVFRTDTITNIDPNTKTLIFSDQELAVADFPELKYSKINNIIWFDSMATIAADTNLKMIFWDKFQDFLS